MIKIEVWANITALSTSGKEVAWFSGRFNSVVERMDESLEVV